MKKALKILLIILLVLAVITGSVVIWQWKNIKSIWLGLRSSSEEIDEMRNQNQTQLVEGVNEYLDEPLREMTEEEKEKIQSGETSASEVYQKMFEEKLNGTENEPEIAPPTEGEKPPVTQQPTKETKDSVISRYMVDLYKLQNEFNARAEATIIQGAKYYESIKAHPQDPVARANTITKFTPTVRSIEKECDTKVEDVIKKLENDLKKIGEDTSVTASIRATYQNEKQLKLSYYSNKYLK